MDVFFLGGGNTSATFKNFGSSLGRITSMAKPPGWLCGEFRDELYAEKVPMAHGKGSKKPREKRGKTLSIWNTLPCYGHRYGHR